MLGVGRRMNGPGSCPNRWSFHLDSAASPVRQSDRRRCESRWKLLLFVTCILVSVVVWNTWSMALRDCQFRDPAPLETRDQIATYNSLAVSKASLLTVSNNGSSTSNHNDLVMNSARTFQPGQTAWLARNYLLFCGGFHLSISLNLTLAQLSS